MSTRNMNQVHQLFFQGLATKDVEIPIRHLAGGTYIEHTNLDGPQLLLTLADADAALRDNGRLVEGAVLTVKMGDPGGRGDAYFASKFAVCSADPHGDHIMLKRSRRGFTWRSSPLPSRCFSTA